MSFMVYFIICTIIAGVYFSVNIAMDMTGKGKKKNTVEEFNTASMADEVSTVVQETSEDGQYNIVKDDEEDECQEKSESQCSTSAASGFSESSKEYKQDSLSHLEHDDSHEEEQASAENVEDFQEDNHDEGKVILNGMNNNIAQNCYQVPLGYQETLSSEEYTEYVISTLSGDYNSGRGKIKEELDKI